MKKRATGLVLIALVSLLALAAPAAGQQGDGIIVNGAEELRESSLKMDEALGRSLADVEPRIVLRHASDVRPITLVALPSSFRTLVDQVSDRLVLRYAACNRQERVTYPRDLLDDSAAPRISAIEVRPTGDEGVRILWLTDEFATSRVRYGTGPGAYTETVSDTLYVKEHEVALTDLRPKVTYYYQVRSTDQSGNTAASSEGVFATRYRVYLPVVIRGR